MSDLPSGLELHGRRGECKTLDRLVESVRANESRVLVLHGDAGVGKTVLLDYLALRASGCSIIRAAGVESEMELAFAGLHQLCVPVLDHLPRLPDPQREALRTVFGLRVGMAPDRFMVGLAVLSLLSDVAEDRPLVCIVDDVQWIDRTSMQILTFVARRLLAEPIAMVFAQREPLDELELAGLPMLPVGGLGDSDARTLLEAAMPGRLDERVRDRIVAEARGNPLALLELPRRSTMAALAGGFALPNTDSLASRIEQSFLQRLQALPIETQRLLLTAAAEPLGDVTLLWRAAERLGISSDAAVPAEIVGLVELGAQVRFRHPLVRSAIYRAAALRDRHEIHCALAEATDPHADPDRRAWHRAQGSGRPDEEVAGELERAADRARGRGGLAAAAAFLERAAELTPDPVRRGARALAAAQAKYEAGAPDAAYKLLMAAEASPLGDLQQARLARLRAQIVFTRKRGSDAPQMLLEAAQRLEPLKIGLARETYLEAFGAALFTGRFDDPRRLHTIAEAARAAPLGPQPSRPIDLLLDGLATRFTEGHSAGVPLLRRALTGFEHAAGAIDDDSTRWLWLAWLVAGDLWDSSWWYGLADRAILLAREAGALTVLPVCLESGAGAYVHAGKFAAAAALIEESESISRATGNTPLRYSSLILAAWRGDEPQTLQLVETRTHDATASGEGRVLGLVEYVTAVLNNGFSRYEAALTAAQRGCEYDDLELCGFSLIELIEAGARSEAHDVAAEALAHLEERTRPAGTHWALGVQARSRALLSEGQVADRLYQEAIDRLERSRIAVHLARAHLVYGEWLRRKNRRMDAREHLRIAYHKLSDYGADAFAERARRELLATGETVRQRTIETRDDLTSQEAQIARLAAAGHTNTEIGSQLFISPRTVEYHLHKVFAKLGLNSRRELRGALRIRSN